MVYGKEPRGWVTCETILCSVYECSSRAGKMADKGEVCFREVEESMSRLRGKDRATNPYPAGPQWDQLKEGALEHGLRRNQHVISTSKMGI